MTSASLSSVMATLIQIKVVAKAVTAEAEQIKTQLFYKASAKTEVSVVEKLYANSAT